MKLYINVTLNLHMFFHMIMEKMKKWGNKQAQLSIQYCQTLEKRSPISANNQYGNNKSCICTFWGSDQCNWKNMSYMNTAFFYYIRNAMHALY